METLYDILEVSRKASKEIIEKAYKTLAKKYHPDLQVTEEDKKIAEEKMKKISYDEFTKMVLKAKTELAIRNNESQDVCFGLLNHRELKFGICWDNNTDELADMEEAEKFQREINNAMEVVKNLNKALEDTELDWSL